MGVEVEQECWVPEHVLDASIAGISHALLHMERSFGEELPDEGQIHTTFDDSIITDTAAEKAQDMAEVGVTMHAWEYRAKWYGEEEKVAKARAGGLGKSKDQDAWPSAPPGRLLIVPNHLR